jgi:hypothetical protein
VLLDLKEECGKHGEVYEVKVPRPANPKAARHLFGTGNYGKVRACRMWCGVLFGACVLCGF